MMDFYTVEPCASSDAFEIKFKRDSRIDLVKAESVLSKKGEVLARTAVVLVFKADDYSASIYASGRVMLKNVTREQAEKLAGKLSSTLEKGGAFI
jgi:hypothetical protein